ncbi:hypothetical protein PN447_17220 [Anabaena sp. CS-542/02]|nr:hypothetical protein [Anabaena sp. CS-542/02]
MKSAVSYIYLRCPEFLKKISGSEYPTLERSAYSSDRAIALCLRRCLESIKRVIFILGNTEEKQ